MKKIFLYLFMAWVMLNPLTYAQDSGGSSSSLFPPPSSSDPQYTNGYYAGTEVGMNVCRQQPSACGISRYLSNGVSELDIQNETIAQCQNDPNSCEIDTEAYTETGRQQCQNDPASCGIDTAAYIEAGRQQCQNDPASCGIEVIDTSAYIEEGRQQCRNDPASCGIVVNLDPTAYIEEGRQQCRNDPASCGIQVNPVSTTHGWFSLQDGNLYLPAIDVPSGFDGSVMTFEVQMKIISGREPLSFSVTTAVPIE